MKQKILAIRGFGDMKKVKDPTVIKLCHYTIPVIWKEYEDVYTSETVDANGYDAKYNHLCWGITNHHPDGSVDIVMTKGMCARQKIDTLIHEAFHVWTHTQELKGAEWDEELVAQHCGHMVTALFTQNPKLLKWIEYNLQCDK